MNNSLGKKRGNGKYKLEEFMVNSNTVSALASYFGRRATSDWQHEAGKCFNNQLKAEYCFKLKRNFREIDKMLITNCDL